jgi:hypothetical protein
LYASVFIFVGIAHTKKLTNLLEKRTIYQL